MATFVQGTRLYRRSPDLIGRLLPAGIALCMAASFASLVPTLATGSGGAIEKLNAPLVTYRTSGIAYVRDASGKYAEAPLVSAALGAGDRIRYLIVATNSTASPQLAGVAVTIPDYTVWDPDPDYDSPDIVQWTADRVHWHGGIPPAGTADQVKVVRWVLSDKLRGGLSTAFVFQLRLTGPFSDRTGDLNMSRPADVKPIETLNDVQIEQIQHDADIDPGVADPLGLSALFADKARLLHLNGQVQAQIAVRNDVAYRVSGTAYVRDDHGIVTEVPLAQARLHAGDRVRFVFTAQNVGDTPRQAGSTFTIPAYTRFEAATNGQGVADVSADGVNWRPLDKRGKMKPRLVRWTHAGRLAPGESAEFMVMLTVDRAPAPTEFTASGGQGSFDPLSASMIQSVLFTHDLTTGHQPEYSGVPLTEQIVRGVKALTFPAMPGFVASGATPIPEHQPVDESRGRQIGYMSALIFGGLAFVGVIVLLFRRNSSPGVRNWAPEKFGARGRSGVESTIIGSSFELDDRKWAPRGMSRSARSIRDQDDRP